MSYPETRVSIGSATRRRTADCWRGLLEVFNTDPISGKLQATNTQKARLQGTVDTFVDGLWLAEDDVAGATAESCSTGVLPAADRADGIVSLNATTGSDNRGVKVQAAGGATTLPEIISLPTDATDPRGDVAFEFRGYFDNTAVDQWFVGLAVNAAAVLASGVLEGAQSAIGFLRTDAGKIQFVVRNDNAGGTAVAYSADVSSVASFATAGWHNLAFRVNKDFTCEVYVDDVKIVLDITTGTKIKPTVGGGAGSATTAYPIVGVVRTLAIGRGATADLATVALPFTRFEAYQQG